MDQEINVYTETRQPAHCYHPQMKLRKVIFFTPVCQSVYRTDTPPGQTPPWTDTSLNRHPLDRHLPGQTPP